MDSKTKKYLSDIGRKGGAKSRRVLTSKQAKAMVQAREDKKKTKEHETIEPQANI